METIGKCPRCDGGLLWHKEWEDVGVGDLHTWSLRCPDPTCDFGERSGQYRDTCIQGGTTHWWDLLPQARTGKNA